MAALIAQTLSWVPECLTKIYARIKNTSPSPPSLLWAALPHTIYFAIICTTHKLYGPRPLRPLSTLLTASLIAVCQYSCLFAGVLPISLLYDTLIPLTAGILAKTSITFFVRSLMMWVHLLEFRDLMQARGLAAEDNVFVVIRALIDVIDNFNQLDAEDNGGDDNDVEPDVLDRQRLAVQPASTAAMYQPQHHRFATYRASGSFGQSRSSETPLRAGTHLLEPVDRDISGPLLLRIQDKDEQSCLICWEPFDSCDLIGVLPCKHTFHEGCLKRWFENHFSCPRCTKQLEWRLVAKDRRAY